MGTSLGEAVLDLSADDAKLQAGGGEGGLGSGEGVFGDRVAVEAVYEYRRHMMAGLALGIENSAIIPALATQEAVRLVVKPSTVNYSLNAAYGYQSEATLIDQVKLLNLMGGN